MDITKVIEQLVVNKVIIDSPTTYKKLTGGTMSELYVIEGNEPYVIKINEPKVIEEEAYFLTFYENKSIFPKLLYVDPLYRYMVYSFIPGSIRCDAGNKKDILFTLVQKVVHTYKPAMKMDQWGWKEEPVASWQDFLLERVMETCENVRAYIAEADFQTLLKLVRSSNRTRYCNQPFLLHGDCGFHNFICKENKLYGVIDPFPVLGDPIYDLIYAFCSTPEELTTEMVDEIVEKSIFRNRAREVLYEEVAIVLYCRLDACVRHHPEDLDAYLKAWHYWMNQIRYQ
ncbi:aminoglycoside phosphotransferase family protein [Bacillus sp. TL12]|uniref:aminoglycoside phosphotransferase family protein n=1 Tax=Bacillus sp. TL12 TaxID=2894756 RepID=UPI001F527C76|nr:aminoglycoside phosphotransferase family protein [Bacillus sp. TL12]MCI0765443.1 aminoglycoside phosphotransferase family protein [Bacillus sp. TL12]